MVFGGTTWGAGNEKTYPTWGSWENHYRLKSEIGDMCCSFPRAGSDQPLAGAMRDGDNTGTFVGCIFCMSE